MISVARKTAVVSFGALAVLIGTAALVVWGDRFFEMLYLRELERSTGGNRDQALAWIAERGSFRCLPVLVDLIIKEGADADYSEAWTDHELVRCAGQLTLGSEGWFSGYFVRLESDQQRTVVIRIVGEMGERASQALQALVSFCRSEDCADTVRESILRTLPLIGARDARVIQAYQQFASDSSSRIRLVVAACLSLFHSSTIEEELQPVVERLWNDESLLVRSACIHAILPNVPSWRHRAFATLSRELSVVDRDLGSWAAGIVNSFVELDEDNVRSLGAWVRYATEPSRAKRIALLAVDPVSSAILGDSKEMVDFLNEIATGSPDDRERRLARDILDWFSDDVDSSQSSLRDVFARDSKTPPDPNRGAGASPKTPPDPNRGARVSAGR